MIYAKTKKIMNQVFIISKARPWLGEVGREGDGENRKEEEEKKEKEKKERR